MKLFTATISAITMLTSHITQNIFLNTVHAQKSPQAATVATGDKKVLVARVDFSDMPHTLEFLPDSVINTWLKGNSDHTSQLNAHTQRASLGRLLLNKMDVMPGVTRMPAVSSSYPSTYEFYKQDVK